MMKTTLPLLAAAGLATAVTLPVAATVQAAPYLARSVANYTMAAKGPASIKVGAAGNVIVTVAPASGWHMNLDYPASLSLTPSSGLSLATAKLKKGDAKRLDDGGLVFEVAVSGVAAGAQSVEGTLKFAVCRDDACAPSKEKVAVSIAVQ